MKALFTNKNTWYKFLKILLSWLGTPYAHWQMEKKKGADCGLFIAACLKEFKIINDINFKRQDRFWHQFTENEIILNIIKDIKSEYYKFVKVDSNKLIKGDILLFNIRSKLSNHAAVYFGNNFMINSLNGKGVCIKHIDSSYFKRLTNVYRIYKCQ